MIDFDLEEYLPTHDFRRLPDSDIFVGKKHMIRILYGSEYKIQFAFTNHFDRWANSVIYETDMPYSFAEWMRICQTVNDILEPAMDA